MLQVPRAALLNWNVAARTAQVIVVQGTGIEMRAVTIGAETGSAIAIESGVGNGEQVVVRGGFALKPGDRVTVVNEGV